MKKIIIIWIAGYALFAGCSLTSAVDKEYALINYRDGINRDEAVVIAKKQLSRTNSLKNYNMSTAKIMENHLVRAYPDYWFIEFESTKLETTFWRYLVVVEKITGRIQFGDPYVPLDVINYQWVFQKINR